VVARAKPSQFVESLRMFLVTNHIRMHLKLRVFLARWLAARAEKRTRHFRRALRDHQRAESQRIRSVARRARGLRLYASWACKDNETISYGTIVPLQASSNLDDERKGEWRTHGGPRFSADNFEIRAHETWKFGPTRARLGPDISDPVGLPYASNSPQIDEQNWCRSRHICFWLGHFAAPW
jgi:hypothetical protein